MSGKALDPYEERILANVRDHGCHVTYVFDPDGNEPSFAYSAGFPETVGQPDIIVFGLSHDVMHFMVNEVYSQCREGLALSDWIEFRGLLEGHRCIARVVSQRAVKIEYFNSAMWLAYRRTGEDMVSAIQIVWPGAIDGLFPWEQGCDERVVELQPALYAVELNS